MNARRLYPVFAEAQQVIRVLIWNVRMELRREVVYPPQKVIGPIQDFVFRTLAVNLQEGTPLYVSLLEYLPQRYRGIVKGIATAKDGESTAVPPRPSAHSDYPAVGSHGHVLRNHRLANASLLNVAEKPFVIIVVRLVGVHPDPRPPFCQVDRDHSDVRPDVYDNISRFQFYRIEAVGTSQFGNDGPNRAASGTILQV